MGGWVKLYRELIDKPIWLCSSSEHKTILITLLLMANHEEKEWIWQGEKYKCKPGQFITSLSQIAKKSGTSIKNVRTALKNFEQIYDFLASESTNKNRLITIKNWELYQLIDSEVANKTASKWQASGKQVATNKNNKNDKNDKNKNIYIYMSDSPEYKLASYLFDWIKKNNPNAKKPNLNTWSKSIDLMIRVDNRTEEQIKQVIDWCQQNDFWYKIILSASKLRQKFDTLTLQMGGQNGRNSRGSGTPKKFNLGDKVYTNL